MNVKLVDESASGFGVESDRELFVREGELAGLTTTEGLAEIVAAALEIVAPGA